MALTAWLVNAAPPTTTVETALTSASASRIPYSLPEGEVGSLPLSPVKALLLGERRIEVP